MFRFIPKKSIPKPQIYTVPKTEPPLISIPTPPSATFQERKRIERLNAVIPNLRQNYIGGLSEGAFAAFPAMELIRVREDVEDGIDWQGRWTDAGGKLYNGRMVALKTDPIWTMISDYGVPYAPFEFHHVMGTQDVGRKECIALGISPPLARFQIAMRQAGVSVKVKTVRIRVK